MPNCLVVFDSEFNLLFKNQECDAMIQDIYTNVFGMRPMDDYNDSSYAFFFR